MRSKDVVKSAVRRSASRLDLHFRGDSWLEEINLDTLIMSSSKNCILGQLFGNYRRGCDILGIKLESQDTYAFTAGLNFGYTDANEEWSAYIKEARKRQNNPCGEIPLGEPQPCTVQGEHKPLYIVKRFIPDPTNPRSEIEIIVMATHSEEKSGGAILALNSAGIKCRRSETVLV